jgi:hypothetical protein
MKIIAGLLIWLFLVGVSDAIAQADYDYVRDVWPELYEIRPDPVAAPIQWFVHGQTAIVAEKDEIKKARLQLQLIQSEVAVHPEIEWAGLYVVYASDIGHLFFAIAPEAGFISFETIGCGSALQNIHIGKADFKNDLLNLIPSENPSIREAIKKQSYFSQYFQENAVYVPVKWNKANFLVQEKYVANFCKEFIVGGKLYSWEGEQFSTTPSPLIKLYGTVTDETLAPILPVKYSHLAKRPIIISVKKLESPTVRCEDSYDESWELRRTVIFHQGRRQGIKRGMEFITPGRDLKYKINLQITHAEAGYSVGKYTLSIPAEVKKDKAQLKKFLEENDLHRDSKLRTNSRWYDIQGI